jgi:hypothetical protein
MLPFDARHLEGFQSNSFMPPTEAWRLLQLMLASDREVKGLETTEEHMQGQTNDMMARATYSGSAAGLASAAAASTGAMKAGHGPFAALNAVSHCLWPDAIWQEQPSVKYTGLGAAIHMGSAVFWGVLFEALCGPRSSASTIVTAAATTALVAYVIDYHAVPKRVTPGFETHLPKHSLAMTYVALGAGFTIAALIRQRRLR